MDILMQEQMKNRNTMMNFNTELDRIGAMNILVDLLTDWSQNV